MILKNEISLSQLKQKISTWYFDKKLQIIFNNYNQKDKKNLISIEKDMKNKTYMLFTKNNVNYINILINKNISKNILYVDKVFFYVTLKKKQTYVSIYENKKKIFQNTNGIVLKKNNILEKSRKKDIKISMLNVISSIKFYKNNLKNKQIKCFVVSIKNAKTFIIKINKILISEIKQFTNKLFFILTPSITFGRQSFKKIKSIKRRLRKKYNVIDV